MPCKLPKIILNQPGNFRLLQMAFASSLVEIGFEFFPSLAVVFNLGKMLPLRTERFGKAAGEMERDELRQARLIAMREIPPLMPAAKTPLCVLHFRGRGPTTLSLCQIAHAGIVRWTGTARLGLFAHATDIEAKPGPSQAAGAAGARVCDSQQLPERERVK